MGDPRAFVSFDFDNNQDERTLFVGQSSHSKTPFSVEDWSSKKKLPQAEWEALIKAKVNVCHLMIVLVGRSTASATGVVKEIEFAKLQKVPLFGVYVDGAGSSTLLPSGLVRNRTIAWTWDGVAKAIDQMMGEGKNA